MKKTITVLSTALMAGGILVGCGANTNNDLNDPGANNINNQAPHNRVGYYQNNNNRPNVNRPNVHPNANINNNNMRNNVLNNNAANNRYDSALADRIAARVNRVSGVRNASVLLNNNNVYVAVDTHPISNTHTATINYSIRRAVHSVTPNRNVQVVTDKHMVNRINDVNDRLNNGTAYNEVRTDIRGIVNDLADAARRPFTNNSK